MLCRILVSVILSSFVCFARPVPTSQPASSDPASDFPGPTTRRPHSYQDHISVVRLRVSSKARKLYSNALTLFVKQKFSDAAGNLDAALKLCPAFPDALTLRGGVHLNQGRLDAAEEDFTTAIHIDPTFLSAYIGLADLYNQESRFDNALAAAEEANTVAPHTWNIQYEIARSLIGKGQYDRALAVIDETLSTRPDDHHLLCLARAHALVGLKQYPKAKTELRTYLADDHSADDQRARDLLNLIQSVAGQ